MADETIQETIEQTVKGPASTNVDGVSVQQQDISKQIEADRYLAGRTATASRKTGLRTFTIKRMTAIPDQLFSSPLPTSDR